MNFEAIARFILLFDSSGWLRLLGVSKLSRNLSIVSSSRCLRFSKRIIAWCPCTPQPKRFNKISKIFSAVSRWYCFLAITQFRAVPSKLLAKALHYCLSDKSSSSKSSFITSIQVSIQPSDWSLYHLGFLKTLLDFSLRSLVLDNLVRNVSKDLFRSSKAVAIDVASLECPA